MGADRSLKLIAAVLAAIILFTVITAMVLFFQDSRPPITQELEVSRLTEAIVPPTATIIALQSTHTSTPTLSAAQTPAFTGFSTKGDQAGFITDVTIPDGTLVDPLDVFTKTWRLKNTGSTTWTTEYAIVFSGGDEISAPSSTKLSNEVSPGETADISLVFTAPSQTGSYTANYLLVNDLGQRFGLGSQNETFYVQIQVINPAAASLALFGSSHTVATGETVESIANLYGVTPDNLRIANNMFGDALLPGQRLTIPAPSQALARSAYKFSIFEGDLQSAYPLDLPSGRFIFHYMPDTYPAQDPQAVARLVQRGLDNAEALFQSRLVGSFDVYVAGSLFAPPDRVLRGRSFSQNRRYHFLHDGTGNAADQQYIAAHELTHLFTWNTFGKPNSIMLSEGAAVFAGMTLIRDSNHLPLEGFCSIYLQAGELPTLTITNSYTGHNLDLQNYYTAGCFVGYLINTYGASAFGQLYSSGDYAGIYGKSLAALEQEWRGYLSTVPVPDGIDPKRLVEIVNKVTGAYGAFFPGFTGASRQIAAYRELDLARIAMLEGRLDQAEVQLQKYKSILSGN